MNRQCGLRLVRTDEVTHRNGKTVKIKVMTHVNKHQPTALRKLKRYLAKGPGIRRV